MTDDHFHNSILPGLKSGVPIWLGVVETTTPTDDATQSTGEASIQSDDAEDCPTLDTVEVTP